MTRSTIPEHERLRSASPANGLSVDVEEYFQVAAFNRQIGRGDWERYPSRVHDNTSRVLDLFARNGARATFFVLGWIAERHPA